MTVGTAAAARGRLIAGGRRIRWTEALARFGLGGWATGARSSTIVVMRVRTYGAWGPWVIVEHGGPGAPGQMAPVARGLADSFWVLEPWQRGSGGEPLTVARHVADLHDLVESRGEGERPALVGSSWGAMLTLAYAAAHPEDAGPLVLVGCGKWF